jgi:hypothetical protein
MGFTFARRGAPGREAGMPICIKILPSRSAIRASLPPWRGSCPLLLVSRRHSGQRLLTEFARPFSLCVARIPPRAPGANFPERDFWTASPERTLVRVARQRNHTEGDLAYRQGGGPPTLSRPILPTP